MNPVFRTAAAMAAFSFLSACSSTTSVGELNYAIMNDDLKAVNAGIENGANVNGTNNEMKATPLHTAAMRGNVSMVKALVDAGAEVGIADCRGRTALMYASGAGSVAVSRFLMEQGANVNRSAADGNITCNKGHAGDTALSLAAENNHPDQVRFLLDQGARAGGKRAYAWALAHPERAAVAKQLKAAGYKADEETARLVAELSFSGRKQAAENTQTAQAQNGQDGDDYDAVDAAVDAAAVGTVLSILGAF